MTHNSKRELELLAPARNIDIGIAAIDCGADAVYIAGPKFGARQAAGNDVEDIAKLCKYAHRFGARIFITLNTILFNNELNDAERQLITIQEAGADAVIVQDLALLRLLGRSGVSLPLHASTQCAIRTAEQARFYEDLGFSRLILEREISLEQIRSIREAVNCELEFFVHGALCVCYSGQCYMSEAISGRSANRGACIQACRSLYDLSDDSGNILVKNKALLSLKDYNLRNRIPDLAEAGISSFKIEGRLKNASYVKNVVRDYSSCIEDFVSNNPEKYHRASFGTARGGFIPDTNKTFNRGYTELFIDGKRGKWSTFDSAKGMGEELGTVSSLTKGKNSFRINTRKDIRLNNGDGLSFVGRNSEVIGFRADICNGLEVRSKSIPELYNGAKIFRNADMAFEKELENNSPVRQIEVLTDITISHSKESDEYIITLSAVSEDGRKIVKMFSGGNNIADNQDRMKALFESQLCKTSGIYKFSLSRLDTQDCLLPFLPASMLNNMRRETADALDEIPCRKRPLVNAIERISSAPNVMTEASVTYKSNVANHISKDIYSRCGAKTIEDAYEISHTASAELMRTKYCIRHELGICLKSPKTRHEAKHKLYLLNNGRRFPLMFDCSKCEMAVLSEEQD